MPANTQLKEPSLEEKYTELFPEDEGVEEGRASEQDWLAQPYAQKVVPSTTSSTVTELSS